MAKINGVEINHIIETLKQSLPLIDHHVQKIKNNNDPNDPIDKVMYEKLNNHLEQTKWMIPTLESINKNTVYFPVYVDMLALKEALENQSLIYSVELHPMWNDPIDEQKYPDVEPDYFQMKVFYSRYCMDGNGYHVGYEHVVFVANSIKKSNLKLSGIPYNLSPHVIDPTSFEIESKDCPPEDFPTFDSHETNCDVFKRSMLHTWNPAIEPFPDDCSCGCNDNWNGYTPPDNDFFESEIDNIIYYILHHNQLPEATFDGKTGEWSIGNQVTWKLGDPPNDDWVV